MKKVKEEKRKDVNFLVKKKKEFRKILIKFTRSVNKKNKKKFKIIMFKSKKKRSKKFKYKKCWKQKSKGEIMKFKFKHVLNNFELILHINKYSKKMTKICNIFIIIIVEHQILMQKI